MEKGFGGGGWKWDEQVFILGHDKQDRMESIWILTILHMGISAAEALNTQRSTPGFFTSLTMKVFFDFPFLGGIVSPVLANSCVSLLASIWITQGHKLAGRATKCQRCSFR